MPLVKAYIFQSQIMGSTITILAYSKDEANFKLDKLVIEPWNWKLK